TMSTDEVNVVLRGMLPSLSPSLREAATFYVNHPERAHELTISEASTRIGVSESTLTRLSRLAGFDSFSRFRAGLSAASALRQHRDPGPQFSTDIGPDDDLASVVGKVTQTDVRSVVETAQAVDIAVLDRLTRQMVNARRIVVFGVGGSSIAATDLYNKLTRTGFPAFCPQEYHFALTNAALLDERDALITFSHSGMTPEIVKVAQIARSAGCAIAGVTNNRTSDLAKVCDNVLVTAAHESALRSGATGSRLAQLTIVDCIFVALAQSTLESSQQALSKTLDAVNSRLK